VPRPCSRPCADTSSSAASVPTRRTPGAADMARILLVDDTHDGRFAVAEVLRHLTEHEIVEAGSGPEALAAIEREPFDLVLLDVQMPGMDGYEVCRRLRADPDPVHAQLPV